MIARENTSDTPVDAAILNPVLPRLSDLSWAAWILRETHDFVPATSRRVLQQRNHRGALDWVAAPVKNICLAHDGKVSAKRTKASTVEWARVVLWQRHIHQITERGVNVHELDDGCCSLAERSGQPRHAHNEWHLYRR